MINIQTLLENTDEMRKNITLRNVSGDVDSVISLYTRHKQAQQKLEESRSRANSFAKLISTSGKEERLELVEQASKLKSEITLLEDAARQLKEELDKEIKELPNWLAPDTPLGLSDSENTIIKTWGIPQLLNDPFDHIEVAAKLDLIDFEGGAKVAGPKFYFFKNEAVLLELALTNLALRIASSRGFNMLQTPDLAKNEIFEGIGFSPRGSESNIYRVEGHDLSLVATAEITVGGLHSNETLNSDRLPIKYIATSHCFRTEAGASGRASKGLYRVHQFTKVEMFVICSPQESNAILEEILAIEEEIYQQLKLPYRVMRICAGDLGAPAFKKYDIEAWMPGKGESGEYGEVTSASNCTDFQARRLKIRYKDKQSGKSDFAYTLNGTAIAISRTILAILENYQTPEGGLTIPEALRPFVGFNEIKPKAKKF